MPQGQEIPIMFCFAETNPGTSNHHLDKIVREPFATPSTDQELKRVKTR
jgi:hypothetical protein